MSKVHKFETILEKFGQKGEKTGWTYINIPSDLAQNINPDVKQSYRVLCVFDNKHETVLNLLPMGKGTFILPFKAELQKKLRKNAGDKIYLEINLHYEPYSINQDFRQYLELDGRAKEFFETLPASHRNYFSKWIESAKTIDTKAARIARAVEALHKNWTYAKMIKNKFN